MIALLSASDKFFLYVKIRTVRTEFLEKKFR